MQPGMNTEGARLAASLRYLNQRHKDAALVGNYDITDETRMLRKEVAKKALAYCRANNISHWDFMEAVES